MFQKRSTVRMPRPPDPVRRAQLLKAVADYLLDHGLADMSLRPLASSLGTSPRMLLYHFGSKEQLVAEALAASRERQREATLAWLQKQPELEPTELLRRFWAWQLDGHQPFLRLFFEVYGLALQEKERFPGFLERAVADWLEFIGALLVRAGLTAAQARIAATAVIAGYRGLLLDFLATGDRRRTKRALDLLLTALEANYGPES
jgi:AcrR family transcriptional regulator